MQKALKLNIASISHRSTQFEEICRQTTTLLKKLLEIPPTYSIFFVSSGTEAMERTIENVVEKESFHFINGSFSKRFFDTACELRKKPKKIDVNLGEGFDFANITISKTAELICLTHNETSTGVILPAKQIANIKKAHPDKLIALDIVSSAPYVKIDFRLTDIVFFSVQKGFGLPAGLGIMIISPKAIDKAEKLEKKGINIGTYHSFPTLKKWADKNQTPETPSVLHIYLLSQVLTDMLKIGIQTIRKQTDQKAKLLYSFLDHHPRWSAFVKDKKFRSPTVIVADLGNEQKSIKEALAKKGLIVGNGYGQHKHTHLRIANFPSHSVKDVKKLIFHSAHAARGHTWSDLFLLGDIGNQGLRCQYHHTNTGRVLNGRPSDFGRINNPCN